LNRGNMAFWSFLLLIVIFGAMLDDYHRRSEEKEPEPTDEISRRIRIARFEAEMEQQRKKREAREAAIQRSHKRARYMAWGLVVVFAVIVFGSLAVMLVLERFGIG